MGMKDEEQAAEEKQKGTGGKEESRLHLERRHGGWSSGPGRHRHAHLVA